MSISAACHKGKVYAKDKSKYFCNISCLLFASLLSAAITQGVKNLEMHYGFSCTYLLRSNLGMRKHTFF